MAGLYVGIYIEDYIIADIKNNVDDYNTCVDEPYGQSIS